MIEMGKQYRTRDGREVRIYAVDAGGDYPVHGAIFIEGRWRLETWTSCGVYRWGGCTDAHDLIEVKPRIKRTAGWLNVYKGGVYLYSTRESANENASRDRIACVKVDIDCEHGEGLT